MRSIATLRHAVLIDLDGTLVDTAPDIVAATNRMLQQLHAAPLPFNTVTGFIGNGVAHLVRRVLQVSELGSAVQEQHAQRLFYENYRDTNGRFGQVFPGVRSGLTSLQQAGYQLGCVTNKPLAFTEALLQLTGLAAYFEVVVAGDSIAQMKPDPAPLLHACRQMQADPALCVLVGDSAVDVAAARAAHMPVYIVRYGYPGAGGYDGMQCDALIESFTELPALLAQRSLPFEGASSP
jgi:phosphoglycolate phosphatase